MVNLGMLYDCFTNIIYLYMGIKMDTYGGIYIYLGVEWVYENGYMNHIRVHIIYIYIYTYGYK